MINGTATNGIPDILKPIADEIDRRARSMAGDQVGDPFVLAVSQRIVVNEALGRIAYDSYLDDLASA